MKKYLVMFSLLVCTMVSIFANEVAVLANTAGKVELWRTSKNIKIKNVMFLLAQDELRVGENSSASFKFIDGTATLRMFSNTTLGLIASKDSVNLRKTAMLSHGSVFFKVHNDRSDFYLASNNSYISTAEIQAVARTNPNGETKFIVLEGEAELTIPIVQATETISAGSIAIIQSNGSYLVRASSPGDLSAEEYKVVYPPEKGVPQKLTIPMMDSAGRVKYLEISW